MKKENNNWILTEWHEKLFYILGVIWAICFFVGFLGGFLIVILGK